MTTLTNEEYEQMNWRPIEELEEIGRNTEQRPFYSLPN
jgi:hypothetical protein